MIEDLVLVTDGEDGTVGVAGEVARGLWIFVIAKANVADRDDGAAEVELTVWFIGDGVAELVSEERRIDEVIFVADLSHGGSLEELVAFPFGAFAVSFHLADDLWLADDGHHVFVELAASRAFFGLLAHGEWVMDWSEAGVEIDVIAFDIDAWVKGEAIAFLSA